jgi:hypothetical protein
MEALVFILLLVCRLSITKTDFCVVVISILTYQTSFDVYAVYVALAKSLPSE